MYVVVRKDLRSSQKAVQAGHALAEYLMRFNTTWSNGILVYLQVASELAILDIADDLRNQNLDFSIFREPDIGNEVTAIACCPKNGNIFGHLPLLR